MQAAVLQVKKDFAFVDLHLPAPKYYEVAVSLMKSLEMTFQFSQSSKSLKDFFLQYQRITGSRHKKSTFKCADFRGICL